MNEILQRCPNLKKKFFFFGIKVKQLWLNWAAALFFLQDSSINTLAASQITGIPRFIALCFIVLNRYCIFLQIEGLWQPCVEQAYRRHFSNSICSVRVSVSHFGNSQTISDFLIIVIFVMVICDQWYLMLLLQNDYDLLKAQMMVSTF